MKTFDGKPLMSRWQGIVANSDGEKPEPHVLAAMHAMFMSGASAALGIISNAPDDKAEAAVREIAEELNDWANAMGLAIKKQLN